MNHFRSETAETLKDQMMLRTCWIWPAIAGLVGGILTVRAQFADSIVAYNPGSGANTNYFEPKSALGEPSRMTPDPFGGPVDPFSPPWQSGQLVALGTNGLITVQFNRPILDHPSNPFGLDFILFGNAGFVITNGNFSGGGITDGSLFGANSGQARVSVSVDNVRYYPLNPALAPKVDALYPTDGSGDFHQAVDPSLGADRFSGRDLPGIRALYAGSGGGAGFDIAWAQDESGRSVALPEIRFIRVEVLDGLVELDAVAAVTPVAEPFTTIRETFSSDPATAGWRVFGQSSLFGWDSAKQALEVTWDSSKPNSYFQRSLGTMLNRRDDFSVGFDLRLNDFAAGVSASRPSTFPLSIGFQNSADATAPDFEHTTGTGSPNLVEFSFFPDTGFGPTVWPAIWSTNASLNYNGSSDFAIVNLPTGVTMRVQMNYAAGDAALELVITTNGLPIGQFNPVKLNSSFSDFQVDTFAIASFASTGPDSAFAGSLLAHGAIDNIVLTLPPPPVSAIGGAFVNQQWQTLFSSRLGWTYVLEASQDLKSWMEVSARQNGTGSSVTLLDTSNAQPSVRFYRVKAERTE